MADDPTPSPDSAPFKQVFDDECADIRTRRAALGARPKPQDKLAPDDLKGLALSGGGIRSATFCLGVLQGLNKGGVLKEFDYLSTVSGGGFIGGWWSAWLSRPDSRPSGSSSIFPPEEKLETDRGVWRAGARTARSPDQPRVSLSALNAGIDPTHHLRLFANYLTPRKGALSGDTWRAITVVSRNLLLTILMLVPLLAAAILLSQFYFTTNHQQTVPYICGTQASDSTPRLPGTRVCPVADSVSAPDPSILIKREAYLAQPLLVLAGALILSLMLWMVFSIGRAVPATLALSGIAVIVLILTRAFAVGAHSELVTAVLDGHPLLLLLTGAGAALIYSIVVILRLRFQQGGSRQSTSEVLTNLMTQVQGTLLVATTVLTITLVFGGFAHEAVRYALQTASPGGDLGRYVARTGGWIAVIWAAAGALYTGFKAAPTGGADSHQAAPSRWSRVIFAVTPPMVLLVLLVLVASLTHSLLGALMVTTPGTISPLLVAFFLAILLCEGFGTYDYCTDADAEVGDNGLIVILSIGVSVIVTALATFAFEPLRHDRRLTGLYLGIVAGMLVVPWGMRVWRRIKRGPLNLTRWQTATVFAIGAVTGGTLGYIAAVLHTRTANPGSALVVAIALGGISYAGAFVLMSGLTSSWINLRMLTLHTVAALLLGLVLLPQFLDQTLLEVVVPTDIIALVGVVIGGIVGFGWLLDPNYVSLHTFYRARLVRAYLGASNAARHEAGKEITESVKGDDVLLAALDGADKGGPYHLINSTLSLVGGRDLATAQRSSTYFTMSRRYCGSLHTGYRPTADYMDKQLSLGTAVAISGAAASPNMGSKTPSAALAMLMALLNVRLGFWAPTPNQPRWKSRGPRLWPFYLLREFLSQTNDLGPYCYLTDGGHFDNTALYSLVQRGCRTIVFVDCGADPTPCFSDVGDAIRRCRIDFGADIRLEVQNFLGADPAHGHPPAHYVLGKVVYADAHLTALGWKKGLPEADRTGTIIWIKPSRLLDDPAEVRQYGLENGDFPQQSTADQWFDEAQFESYRRLGEASAAQFLVDRKDTVFPGLAV